MALKNLWRLIVLRSTESRQYPNPQETSILYLPPSGAIKILLPGGGCLRLRSVKGEIFLNVLSERPVKLE